jgi:hypothetical protein
VVLRMGEMRLVAVGCPLTGACVVESRSESHLSHDAMGIDSHSDGIHWTGGRHL